MIISGVILIFLQILSLIAPITTGRPIFNGNIFELIGYFSFSIIGIILLVIGIRRKKARVTTENEENFTKEDK